MKRIGIDLKYLRNAGRGGNLGDEAVQRSLLRHLGASDPETEYHLYVGEGFDPSPYEPFLTDRMRVRPLPRFGQNGYTRNLIALPRELRENPVDLFHGSASLPFFSRALARRVITAWEFSPLKFPQYFPRSVVMTRSFLYKRDIPGADHVITGTEFMKGEIMEAFDLPAERVTAIHLGVEERFLEQRPRDVVDAALARQGVEAPYLLAVGDLYPKKNVSALIRAVNLLAERGEFEGRLVVVGARLWKTAELEDLDLSHTTFTGFVPDEDLPSLYQGARAFVFPSVYEGFGIPVLEAMASGVPLALSDNSSFPEIALEAAAYFDPFSVESIAETVGRVLSDEILREKLVAAGRVRIEQFHWRDLVPHYGRLYHSVLAS